MYASAPSSSLLASELTAWGTIAVAIAAVGVAVFTEWRASIRVRAEREAARLQAQETDAWAVQVRVAVSWSDERRARSKRWIVAAVTNYGSRPIGRVRAQFSPDGETRIGLMRAGYFPPLLPDLPSPFAGEPGVREIGYATVLPTGGRVNLLSEATSSEVLTRAEAIVRWRDHYGQEWEHVQGRVERTEGSDW